MAEKCEICSAKADRLYSSPCGNQVCYECLRLLKWAAMLVWEETEEVKVTT